MPKNVTIKDIAAEAGVSIALVSFVMNNRIEADGKQKYRVNENTRQRILEVAHKLNYQPSSAARMLRRGRSLVIGAILSDISNVFYGEIARLLGEVAFKYGYTVLFGSSYESPDKFDRIVRSFLDRGVDGFIAVPCVGAEKSLHHILNIGIPLVIMDRKDLDIPAPKIVLDNESAMRDAVSILARRGLRKIELLSFEMRVSSIMGREAGFISAMRELGVPEEDITIHRITFDGREEEAGPVISSVLDRKVEGLICATNALSMAAIRHIAARNARIPQDLHFVGFDNSDVYGLFNPPIPHIGQPMELICQESFLALKKLIDNEMEQTSTVITLKGEIID